MSTVSTAPTAAAVEAPVGPDAARALIAGGALTDAPIGPVGLELERHVVDLASPGALVTWRRLRAATAGLALPGGSRLSFEPGGQVELSTSVAPGVLGAVEALRADSAVLAGALGDDGLGLVGVGVDPARSPVRVSDGARYAAMAAYWSAVGQTGTGALMMCSTASLQLNLEAGPRAGWADRITLVHALGPVLSAMAACSPLLGGVTTGWASSRQRVWQELDPARTAPFPGRGDPGGAWASFALAAPLMMLRRSGSVVGVTERTTLLDWVGGARRPDERPPTGADVAQHLTTLWPPLRLRGFLELRMLDAVPMRWWPGLAALVTTLLDDPRASEVAAEVADGAVGPVAGRWADAARLGLADPAIRAAVHRCTAAALPLVPAGLRTDATAYAELLASGRTPGDLLRDSASEHGPLGCLLDGELA